MMINKMLTIALVIGIFSSVIVFSIFIGKIYHDMAENVVKDAGQVVSGSVISRSPLDMILSPKAD